MALMSVKIAKKKCSMSLDSVFWISGFSNARPESLDDILSFSWKGVLWQYSPHSVIAVYDWVFKQIYNTLNLLVADRQVIWHVAIIINTNLYISWSHRMIEFNWTQSKRIIWMARCEIIIYVPNHYSNYDVLNKYYLPSTYFFSIITPTDILWWVQRFSIWQWYIPGKLKNSCYHIS